MAGNGSFSLQEERDFYCQVNILICTMDFTPFLEVN